MKSWEFKAVAKRASIFACITQEWRPTPDDLSWAADRRDMTGLVTEKFLDEDEKAIIKLDSVPVVEATKSRGLTALQVAEALCKTAAIAHQVNPCLLENFLDQAFARAKELDEYQEAGGQTVGPLHGLLPVSLKDQFRVQGVDTIYGICR